MNRLLIGIGLGIIIVIILPYLVIPSTVRKRMMALVPVNQKSAHTVLLDDGHWSKWWPADSTANAAANGNYLFNGHRYRAGMKYLTGIDLITDHNGDSTLSRVTLIPLGKDTVSFTWEYELVSSYNPLTRYLQDRRAKEFQHEMSFVLQALATYLSDEENIYGIKVTRTKVTDTLLIMTRATLSHEPDEASVYKLIHQLQTYALQGGATATNAPMLHKRKLDSSRTEVLVALPVNKQLQPSGNIDFKRMVPGNILVTEVQGGPDRVKKSFVQLENYLTDHGYESPAIPFESLVTDRRQGDSSKWLTRISYPVF